MKTTTSIPRLDHNQVLALLLIGELYIDPTDIPLEAAHQLIEMGLVTPQSATNEFSVDELRQLTTAGRTAADFYADGDSLRMIAELMTCDREPLVPVA